MGLFKGGEWQDKESLWDMLANSKKMTGKSKVCEYCGKSVSYNGTDEDELKEDEIKKFEKHYKKCKVKIREDRINKLLDE